MQLTYEEFRDRLTENIWKMMRVRKITQTQLAVRAGVSLGTITGIITGNRDPSIYSLWAVSRALRIPPEELIGELRYGKSEYFKRPKNKADHYSTGHITTPPPDLDGIS